MKVTTRVGLALLLVAATSVVVGAGSFSSADTDRPTNLSVVGDENAFMSLDYDDSLTSSWENKEGLTLVQTDSIFGVELYSVHEMSLASFQNKFAQRTSNVSVEITDVENDESTDEVYAELVETPDDEMGPGDTEPATVQVQCPVRLVRSSTATVEFDVGVAGEGFSAETTRSRRVDVTCRSILDYKIDLLEELSSGSDPLGDGEETYLGAVDDGGDSRDVRLRVDRAGEDPAVESRTRDTAGPSVKSAGSASGGTSLGSSTVANTPSPADAGCAGNATTSEADVSITVDGETVERTTTRVRCP